MSTNLVTWIVALVIGGAIWLAVVVGDDRGWGAGMTFAVVGIVAVLVLTPFIIWMTVRKKRRAQGFAAAAAKIGIQVAPEEGPKLLAMPFRLFRLGRGREIENVAVRDADGQRAWIADFMYWRETYNPQTSSTSRHDYEHTCAVVQVDGRLPSVVIGREGFWSRVARAIGLDDVEVGDEGFDRVFKVRAPDPGSARDLLQPDLRAWLISVQPQWSFETAGNYVLAFTDRLPLSQLSVAEETARAFVEHIHRRTRES